MTKCIVEQAALDEMKFLLDCAKAEGWNPGLSGAVPFYYTDPYGFFIAKLGNKPIGCISAVAYNNSYQKSLESQLLNLVNPIKKVHCT